ncbi:alpha/beta hydrolase [Mycobacterium sp. CBMA293]|uniref:alpha/beta fold hydrolase n=2 Tax=Mycolicibacterium TaxID=1866885 RepID=UPI0012DD696A|nr:MULTISPECIES: alpha/beta hydrolase [unclassified Mycolicibacterium]MUL48941.1 alpha/beta hydrolase [Mycolicibacterium sp. CBMA 360]MUL58645.1 alpha/beta hydrolase [Mycolicibacterium sp. CBMA 335]MUL74103.1 alpha/beta hydrolase [Mycolicibacterium sp. CBMA 311]MUL93528.1 alpha/beta hydrolase [Mycolicibacterium sp. CBMA 230]MUM04746.1 alpha/beta hydrolase [Mycolicibacterium sp. CBMA 213]
MVMSIERPKLEGNIAVGEGRQIGFAEFGNPQGRAVFWLHGTPGARRQIPTEARTFAARKNIRLIGIDRPGIGSSTPHQYENVLGFTDDLRTIADILGINRFAVVGLSGGGPYTLATAAAMPDRVVMAAVLGGVAPLIGEDGISSGLMELAKVVRPVIEVADAPLRWVAGSLIKLVSPFGSPALDLYARISPDGDRNLLSRPEFKAMFLDDLLNGSRKQLAAPFADVVVFARDWGFRLEDIKVPVRWWHGDADHIVPFAHGEHAVARLADAELYTLPGESHLAGLGVAEDILAKILEVWDADLAAQ